MDEDRLMYLFIEGLKEPLKGMVSLLKLKNLEDTFEATLNLESSTNVRPTNSRVKTYHKGNGSYEKENSHKKEEAHKNFLSEGEKEKLRKQN